MNLSHERQAYEWFRRWPEAWLYERDTPSLSPAPSRGFLGNLELGQRAYIDSIRENVRVPPGGLLWEFRYRADRHHS